MYTVQLYKLWWLVTGQKEGKVLLSGKVTSGVIWSINFKIVKLQDFSFDVKGRETGYVTYFK